MDTRFNFLNTNATSTLGPGYHYIGNEPNNTLSTS